MPELFLSKLYKKIKYEWKLAFLSSFIIGFFTYLWHLGSFLVNGDSIHNFHSRQNTIHLGRCFLTYTCGISSYYDLPTVNGLLGILYVSLCSACIVELFQIRKKLSIVLVSGLFITFPSVASTFAYNFTADGYLLAMLFSALAVLLTWRFKLGFLPGAVLLCISYGSYQAYISFTLMLILIWILWQILNSSIPLSQLTNHIIRFFIMGVLGSAGYLITLRFLLKKQGKSLSSYQGIAGFDQFNPGKIKAGIYSSLSYFKHFFFGDLKLSLYTLLNMVIIFLVIFALFYLLIRNKVYRSIPACLMIIICIAALPFATTIFYFISAEVAVHTLMCAGFSLIFLIPILYMDQIKTTSFSSVLYSWITLLVLILSIYNFILAANINFLYMNRSYEITYGMALRIVDRIEQIHTDEPITQIGVIGEITTEDSGYNLNLPPEMTGAMYPYLVSEQFGINSFLKDYFNLSLQNAPDDVVIPFVHSEKYRTMDTWPGKNSVIVDGNTVYIKFDDVEW